MNKKNFKKLSAIASMALLVAGTSACNQGSKESDSESENASTSQNQMADSLQNKPLSAEEVTKEELKTFLNAAQQLRSVQMEASQNFKSAIEASDLNLDRYKEIAQAQNDSVAPDTMNITDAEQSTFDDLRQDTSQLIRQEMQDNMKAKVEEMGMDWNRFERIRLSMRSDKQLQQKLRSVQQEMMGGGQGGGSQSQQQRMKQKLKEKMQQQQQQQQGGGQQSPQSQQAPQ